MRKFIVSGVGLVLVAGVVAAQVRPPASGSAAARERIEKQRDMLRQPVKAKTPDPKPTPAPEKEREYDPDERPVFVNGRGELYFHAADGRKVLIKVK